MAMSTCLLCSLVPATDLLHHGALITSYSIVDSADWLFILTDGGVYSSHARGECSNGEMPGHVSDSRISGSHPSVTPDNHRLHS